MKKTKIIIAIFMMFNILFIFSGCAKINYSVIYGEQNSIYQQFKIELDDNELNAIGFSEDDKNDVKDYIKDKILNYHINIMNNFQVKLNQIEDIKTKTKYQSEVEHVLEWKENLFTYQLKFASPTIYNFFYDVDENKEDDNEIVKELFFTKRISSNKTIFQASYDQNVTVSQYFLNEMKEYIETKFGENAYQNMKKPEFTFAIKFNTPKVYSDADYVKVVSSTERLHIWSVNPDNPNQEISLYTMIPNTWVWYVSALVLTILFIASMLTWHLIKNKKAKNIKMQ